jgi:AcrR family transcriptional regulator
MSPTATDGVEAGVPSPVEPPLRRPRGRPARPDLDAPSTRARLLSAAAAACIDHGFEGATVADIAARANVSAPAIYNHFGGRVELLVAAARASLAELPAGAADGTAAGVVRAFLSPEFAATRRLLSELHVAAQRHAELAELLDAWHAERADEWVHRVADRDRAAVKAFFLVLLGCCQLDALGALDSSPDATRLRIEQLISVLFPEEADR